MLKPHLALEDVEHGLDNEALAQHALVGQRHQTVLHIAPDAGDQVQATLPKFAEQVPADMALVGVDRAAEMLADRIEHGAVGGVAGGDLQRHDLALVADHEVQLEAKKPPSSGHSNGYAAGTFGQPCPWRSCRERPG